MKLKRYVGLLFLSSSILSQAGTIKSPDGNLSLDFKLDGGVPRYALACLAALSVSVLIRSLWIRCGSLSGVRKARYAIIIARWWWI